VEPRPALSPQRLLKAALHVQYEIDQMLGAAELWSTASIKDVVIDRALFESMLLHLRGLLEVVCRRQKGKTDIIPLDFGVAWGGPLNRKRRKPLLDALTNLDQNLAHLSLGRVNEGVETDPPTDWSAIVTEVTAELVRFIDLVEATHPELASVMRMPLQSAANGQGRGTPSSRTMFSTTDLMVHGTGIDQ